MNRIWQAIVWLRRIHHCRGFGIQSPTDYSFVTDVVNEHAPYYAYSEVGENDTWLRRKKGKLYFRLANHLQPDTIVDLAGYADYLRAGCRRATLASNSTDVKGNALIVTPASSLTTSLIDACHNGSMLVVEDIGKHQRQWHAVVERAEATVTFDLYYCGIATFNPARAKQNYIVNF